MKCECGHSERMHNKPQSEGGANWGPVGCYFLTDTERPTVCGCTEMAPLVSKCLCGHSSENHINGTGLCIVKSCRLCLIYRPTSDELPVVSEP